MAELLRLTPGGCLIIDTGVVRGANEDAVDALAIPRNRLIGTPLPELMVDEMQFPVARFLDESGSELTTHHARLANGLTPIELTARRVDEQVVLVGVRPMELEHRMSALAGGELTHDQVTGLPNRYHLLEQLHRRLTAGAGQPLALIAVWIDDLDSLGGESGPRVVERVTRQVAERLQARLRGPDLLGAFGENAYLAVLSSDSPLEQLGEISERLRNEVAFPVEFNGSLVSFTASVFVATVGAKRPNLEKIQARIEAAGQKLAQSGGNRTEMVAL